MEKNKSGKYFKYAIGEIVLVVIGILIALSINNWNQTRLEQIEGKEILNNLKEDFQKAIEEFEFLNALRSDIISTAKEITNINTSNLEQYPFKYLDSLYSKTLSGPTFNNKSGSLNVLLTSGKINLIRNRELRKLLIGWPGDIEDMIEDEITQNELYNGPYQEVLSKYISWNDLMKSYSMNHVRFDATAMEIMPENPISISDYQSLVNDIYFINVLHRRAGLCMISNQETLQLIEKAREIIRLIDFAIDK
jgi:hypothetical protein